MFKKKEKKEEREESFLKELCGDDVNLYDLLSISLYLDPIGAISKEDLESLIEEAEKSIKDENYQEAMNKYRTAVDKALFEATQNLGERARYIKVIQDLASRNAKVGEKVKEKGEKEGFVSSSLEGKIKRYEFMSERIEDVIKIASLFYNERLEVQGAKEGRDARRIARSEADRGEERSEREAKERRVARRKGMGRAG
jgi:Fe2+ transport system protein B